MIISSKIIIVNRNKNALLLNCSPHENGSTFEALTILKERFNQKNVASDIFHIGTSVRSCMGCFQCMTSRKCVIPDRVNELLNDIDNYDGIVVSSPVYFGAPTGGAISFLDRLFEAGYEKLAYKPAASFTVARRAGTASSVDVLNKYFLFSNMPIISNSYINSILGRRPEDIHTDQEGLHLLAELAQNMTWMLQLLKSGRNNKIERPKITEKYYLKDM